MNGKKLKEIIIAMQKIKGILYHDIIEDDLNDYACLHGPGILPSIKDDPFANIYKYKNDVAKAYIVNHLDTIRAEFKEFKDKTKDISELINKMLNSEELDDHIDSIEGLIENLEDWIDKSDMQAFSEGKIKISYEIQANGRLVRTIKDVAEETGYLYSGEQLSDAVSAIAENILDRYLDTEYLDTDIIQDIIQDYFVKQ
jgi:hypothetical protein